MPYFAPPGGSLTARTARALQDSSLSGLGIIPSINVRMPRAIPAAIGAARRFRLQVPVEESTMTGMGIVTAPAAKYTGRYAQPAPVTFQAVRTAAAIRAAQAAAQRMSALHGLGAAAPHPGPRFHFGIMPITAGVTRQAAMFMSPGGGYSQIPGFMPAIGPPMRRMSFLGQDQPEPSTYTAPTDLTPPTVTPPQQAFLLPTPSMPPTPSTYTAPANLTPPSAGGIPIGVQYKPVTFLPSVAPAVPFMQAAPLGIPNQYLIALGAGIILLTTIAGGKRRRNPRRRSRAK